VIQDINAMVANFASLSFIHVYRQGNVLAHVLARPAERFVLIFRNTIPDCILQIFCNVLL
jgi:hypothetical protein